LGTRGINQQSSDCGLSDCINQSPRTQEKKFLLLVRQLYWWF
jgi:hypothetical protein